MATRIGTIGHDNDTILLNNPVYTGITLDSTVGEYPEGLVSFNFSSPTRTWIATNSQGEKIIDVDLCDLSGAGVTVFSNVTIADGNTTAITPSSAIIPATQSLIGKSLGFKSTSVSPSDSDKLVGVYGQITVTVHTLQQTCKLTIIMDEGGSVSGSGIYAPDSVVPIAARSDKGYTFTGWTKISGTGGSFGNASSSETTLTIPSEIEDNITIKANFTKNVYTLSKVISPSAGGDITFGSSEGYFGSRISITVTPAAGYVFYELTTTSGTIESPGSLNTNILLSDASPTITATFHEEQDNYTITDVCVPSEGGTIRLATGSGYNGQWITIYGQAKPGYSFVNWSSTAGSIQNSNVPYTNFNFSSNNVVLTATFALTSVNVIFMAGSGGTVSPLSDYFEIGDNIGIVATPYKFYHFVQWSSTDETIADTTSASTTYTVPSSGGAVTASFAKNYSTISFLAETGGSVSNVSGSYETNTIINLNATPTSGYKFNGWITSSGIVSDSLAPSTTYIIPDESTISIKASFAPIQSDENSGRYNGAVYESIDVSYYNGTNWVDCEVQRYDGSSWVDVDTK